MWTCFVRRHLGFQSGGCSVEVVVNRPRMIFVDVDDTLIRSVGTKRIPMPSVVARVRELHEAGALLYLWSSGGAAYAETSAAELGLSNCFAAFLPKPDAYLDDQAVSDWRFCKHVLPSNAEDL
ncbi:MAG: DUF705 domain-containing protein [Betaproteobacteria bacterium]|nr:MAG: DUF705 domain-containing protein [Betaproteobacteria bacterium]